MGQIHWILERQIDEQRVAPNSGQQVVDDQLAIVGAACLIDGAEQGDHEDVDDYSNDAACRSEGEALVRCRVSGALGALADGVDPDSVATLKALAVEWRQLPGLLVLQWGEAVLVRAPEASVAQQRAVLMQIPLPEGVVLLVHKFVPAAQLGAHHKVFVDLHLRHAAIGVAQLDVADQTLLLGLRAVPALRTEDQVRRTAERDAGL